MKKDKRGKCSGCGKPHYMSPSGRGRGQCTLSLTLKGWRAYDILRRR